MHIGNTQTSVQNEPWREGYQRPIPEYSVYTGFFMSSISVFDTYAVFILESSFWSHFVANTLPFCVLKS